MMDETGANLTQTLDHVLRWGSVLLGILLSPVWICGCAFALLVGLDGVGQLEYEVTRYPDADLVYEAYCVAGSSEWQEHVFILATNRALADVVQHYQAALGKGVVPRRIDKMGFYMTGGVFSTVWIIPLSPNDLVIFNDRGCEGDPYPLIRDAALHYKTMIIFYHTIWAP